MQVIRPILVSDVHATLAAERDVRSGSAPWTLRFIDHANVQFAGIFCEAELSGPEALAVVLPPHRGEPCRGDQSTLVPGGGMTVADAARAFTRMRDAYARENPTCWGRITEAAAAPFSTIILTTAPLALPDYAELPPRDRALYHLDGFHRLVGWASAGRLTRDARIRAFIAGSDRVDARPGAVL